VLSRTALWKDLCELPDALAATLEARDGISETAALLGADRVRRIVATGNGAAYYVAVALWLASLEGRPGPEVVAVPSGFVARGAFRWRPGDALLAISSSGEFRDLVEAVDAGPRAPIASVTATAGSTIGSRAAARALVTVLHQRAVTHSQAFCGAVAAALAVWADVTGDRALARALGRMPETTAAALDAARGWVADVEGLDAPVAVAFGSGPAWAAALEAALLLKEVAGIPAEGLETREAATSAMMAIRPGHLALSLPTGEDRLLREAEEICRARGATVVRAPGREADRRLAAITTFPAAAVLSGRIGLERGLDVDKPAWTDAYYSVARSKA
jgi:glucosamine--fructose-6-phosphate aminotransferase (isomerizing)